ncbi:glycosyltransferase [Alkalimonas mucilaginosa]|uniref:Glycosyltransferase n=1 Tax=Alkalimonas mucilaginosa TaxID=3057676 RepID=A0ABU7JCK0_9GAMM|nr:glycosyltransferase [Alkalimonas sp. MEB004]MEE2022900.1 glycosyltransferase [Alkalimonas sp. MEB004]
MHPKRILFITAEFPPGGGGGVGRTYTAANALAQAGHQVVVLCASANSYSFIDPSYPAPHAKVAVIQVWTPELRHWIRRIRTLIKSFNPADRFFLWRHLAVKKANNLHRKASFDLVISSYPFFSNHAVAYSIAKQFGLPWIADYRDPPWWMYSSKHRIQPEFFDFAKYSVKTITTTERSKTLICEKLGILPDSVQVISNGCDDIAASIQTSLPVDGNIELLHTGSVYEVGRDINALIRVVSKMQPGIKLRFIGDPPYQSTKELLATLPDTDFVGFTPYMPATDALSYAAKTTVLVVIQGDLFENQVPGKVFEYLALQKTILLITNHGSATHQLLKHEPNVVFAEYGNEESIRQGIAQARQHQVVAVDRFRYTRRQVGEQFAALVEAYLDHAQDV